MAIAKGWEGRIRVGSTALSTAGVHGSTVMLQMNSWTLAFSGDALEDTVFGDKDRGYQPGLRTATVDFAGYYESSEARQKWLVDRMKSGGTNAKYGVDCLYSTTPKGFQGDGVLTALSVGGAVDGLVPFTGTFQIGGGMTTL